MRYQYKSPCLGAAAVLSLQVSGVAAQLYNQVIKTAYGSIQGTAAFNSTPSGNITDWENITVWKGIPFAASTAGNNRFKPPQPLQAWNSTLDASEFGAVCPQDFTLDTGLYYGEDCLNLNIWTAGNDTSAKLPVILWSYPAESTAAQPLFDGAGMASKGIVFVNYNYRTGSLGWMSSNELSAEMLESHGTNSSGNWGVLDQIGALKWVHANIAAFGGDPDRITIMGQSAGSAATQHMMNSPLSKDLVVGAIIESGVRDPRDPLALTLAEGYSNMSSNLAESELYMASLNATTIAEMRALPFEDLIIQFRGTYSFGAVLDYYSIPDTYMNTLIYGSANDVPILTGNTKDESGASYGDNVTVSAFQQDLITQYGADFAAEFLKLYPAANDTQASASANARYTDTSKAGTYIWGELHALSSRQPVYTYLWDHAPPGQSQGAYHESEINYVLNNLYGTDLPWTTEDYEIAEKMNSYWANFAKTGNPNSGDSYPAALGQLADFPQWTHGDTTTFQLGNGFQKIPIASDAQIQLLRDYFSTQTPI